MQRLRALQTRKKHYIELSTAKATAAAVAAAAATAAATAAEAAAASAAAPLKQLRNTSTAEAMHLGDLMRKLVHSDKWKVFV